MSEIEQEETTFEAGDVPDTGNYEQLFDHVLQVERERGVRLHRG